MAGVRGISWYDHGSCSGAALHRGSGSLARSGCAKRATHCQTSGGCRRRAPTGLKDLGGLAGC